MECVCFFALLVFNAQLFDNGCDQRSEGVNGYVGVRLKDGNTLLEGEYALYPRIEDQGLYRVALFMTIRSTR